MPPNPATRRKAGVASSPTCHSSAPARPSSNAPASPPGDTPEASARASRPRPVDHADAPALPFIPHRSAGAEGSRFIELPRSARRNRRRGPKPPVALVLCGLIASLGTLLGATTDGRATIEQWAFRLGSLSQADR